ncbi:hypothetical protein BHM03_00009232 [Ensete ventricosum]|nr:hypothetical protein BHM03_00009232 [Ensete ventricosum]
MHSHAALQSTATATPPRPLMALHRHHVAALPRPLSFSLPRTPNLRTRLLLSTVGLGPRKTRTAFRITTSAAAAPAPVDSDVRDALERSFALSPESGPPSCLSSAATSGAAMPVMKGGKYGAFGAVTLEKSKLDLSQKTTRTSPELAVGGGGGDIGKKNFHGGGDGGDDDGDDDDYFDDFDEEDDGDEGGLLRRRMVLQEGLISSAQMVRFLAMNARPTVSRAISRTLPEWLSRAFVGR